MDLWVATSNQGKLNEFRMLLHSMISEGRISLKTYKDFQAFSPPPETGDTFLANARSKTKSFWSSLNGQWVMGEDSGLVVEGLGGLPGVHSARYAGPKASDAENVAKLLKMLQIRQVANRSAKFVCSFVAYRPTGEEWVFEGELTGKIANLPKGNDGFGYDPVFIPDGESKTLAELGQSVKNRISHRAKAVALFAEKLKGAIS